MKKIALLTVLLVFSGSGAVAGLFSAGIEFEDLSYLSPAALESLKETEFAVFLAQVGLGGARVGEKRAEQLRKAADMQYNAASILLKSSTKALDEAKKGSDDARTADAETALNKARRNFDIAAAMVRWREKEVDGREAEVKTAKIAVALAEAKRDLSRAAAIINGKTETSGKFNLKDFHRDVEKKKKEYESAVKKAEKASADAARLKDAYEAMLK